MDASHVGGRSHCGGVPAVGLLILLCGFPGFSQAAPDRPLFVSGGTLVDGVGGPPQSNVSIVIEAGRIKQVGRVGEVTPPAGATVVDAAGKFILPGLIDAHVHYRDWAGELYLAHGVTTVFDMGDPQEWILAVRRGTEIGLIRGPRLFVSGNIVDGVRHGPRASMGGRGGTSRRRFNRVTVETVQGARDATRSLIEQGVDFIKVYQDLTLEQLAAVTDEAHRSGLAVVGHADDVVGAANAGIDGITHLWGVAISCMDEHEMGQYQSSLIPSPYPYLKEPRLPEVVRTLVANSVYVNPLLYNEHASVNDRSEQQRLELHTLLYRPALDYVPMAARMGLLLMTTRVRNYSSQFGLFPPIEKLPTEIQDQFSAGYRRAQEFVRQFVEAGGKIFVGTDAAGASVVPGLSVHHELELLVDSGVSPMRAIEFATRVPAELIGRQKDIGTVEVGKRGDLVIVDGDPLANISNTKKISAVILDGRLIDTDYHRDYTNPIPYPVREFSSSENPVPELDGITPRGTQTGGPVATINITGSGFVLTSVVQIAARSVKTRFVSPSELEVSVPAEFFDSPGTLAIEVVNPQPGGGRSNAFGFVVAPR